MMSDFSAVIDRKNTWSEKWDARVQLFGRDDVLPLWVADMDLPSPPFVMEALRQRLDHPVLGYTHIPDALSQSVVGWQWRRHGVQTSQESVVWLSGVVSGLYLSVQALTKPDEGVLVFTPVYPPFMRVVKDAGRRLVDLPLLLTDGQYELDFESIETVMRQGHVKLLLLSNPHNPSGRMWTQSELLTLSVLCLRYQVLMVSDEIWSDLVLTSEKRHVPLRSLSPEVAARCITLSSVSKTFNLAALQTAYAIVDDVALRGQFELQQQVSHAAQPNTFGLLALQSAYSDQGEAWLISLIQHLREQRDLIVASLAGSSWRWVLPEASYLLWLDGRTLFDSHEALVRYCVDQARLGLSSGLNFGEEGRGFMRLNFGVSRQPLVAALEGLIRELTSRESRYAY